jgi:plasmid stabilization system protein ParE
MIEVDLPDGSVAEFPDGTPPDVMKKAIQKRFPVKQGVGSIGPAAVAQEPASPLEAAGGAVLGAAGPTGEDMTRSAATGLRQGVEGIVGGGGDIRDMLNSAVKYWMGDKTAQTLGDAAVNAFPLAEMMKSAPTSADVHSATEPLVQSAGAGDVLSHTPETTAGEYARTVGQFAPNLLSPGSFGRRVAQTVVPALLSETAGQVTKGTEAEPYARAAAGLAGGIATMGRGAGAPKPAPAPTTSELATEASALFKSSKAKGVVAKPQAMNGLFNKVQTEMQDFGHDVDLQPKTAIVVKRLSEARGKPLSLQEVHNLRKKAAGVAREAETASDRTAAGIVVKQIDQFMDEPANFNANSQEGRDLLRQGMEVSKRKIKSQIVDDVVEKAKNQATGFENGLVVQFRSLANNKEMMRSFSRSEQDMIRSIVRRPSLHGMLRALGMLSPTSTFGGITTGIGIANGVVPGLVQAGVGVAARAGAGALTKAKTAKLQNMVASGLPPVSGAPFDPEALVRLLMTSKLSESSAAANSPIQNLHNQ